MFSSFSSRWIKFSTQPSGSFPQKKWKLFHVQKGQVQVECSTSTWCSHEGGWIFSWWERGWHWHLMLGVPLTFVDWGIWPINWRIIGRLFWKLSCVPKPKWWECVNILNFFFFAITLQIKSPSFLNSSSKWLENMWHEDRSCVTCGRGAALALRCWVAKTSHGDAQGCGNISGLSWQFQAQCNAVSQ